MNPEYMKYECSDACNCHAWAVAGECTNNAPFMLNKCEFECKRVLSNPPSAPPISSATCGQWAKSGECVLNQDFMEQACAAECMAVRHRKKCSARGCAGLADAPACDGLSPSRHNGTWEFAPLLLDAARSATLGLAFVNDSPTPARLFWVDDKKQEFAFGVIMPGARLVQQSYLGHHWRVRQLGERERDEDGELLLETHAQVLVATPCVCSPYLKSPSALIPTVGSGPAELTTLVVELQDSFEAAVYHWNGTVDASIGRLHPKGSRAVNATHQVLVQNVRSGDVITVKRVASGETLLQHVAGDTQVPALCKEPGARQRRSTDRSATEASGPVAATLEATRDALLHRRDAAKEEARALSAALERLKQIDMRSLNSVDDDILDSIIAKTSDALKLDGEAGDRQGAAATDATVVANLKASRRAEKEELRQ